MVTKLSSTGKYKEDCSVLAKILMVTKRDFIKLCDWMGSVLAKILMVTKLHHFDIELLPSSVLAKILMVTKLWEI